MPMPSGIRAIGLMMRIRSDDVSQWSPFLRALLRENAARVLKLD